MSQAIATMPGELRHGKLLVRSWERFATAFRRNKDGPVVIRVERVTATRSQQANAYLWGVVYRLMAEETGHEPEDIHDDMCLRFLTKRLTWVNEQTGEVEERDVPGRSRSLDVNEFYTFVEKVRLFAAEWLGLTIPDPE